MHLGAFTPHAPAACGIDQDQNVVDLVRDHKLGHVLRADARVINLAREWG